MSSIQTVTERLKLIRQALNLPSETKFAQWAGVSQPVAHDAFAGVREPGSKFIKALASKGVSIDWLLSGSGAMWRDSATEEMAQASAMAVGRGRISASRTAIIPAQTEGKDEVMQGFIILCDHLRHEIERLKQENALLRSKHKNTK